MNREQILKLADEYEAALIRKDLNDMMSRWAEDGILRFPYACGFSEEVIIGLDAIREFSKIVPDAFESLSFSNKKRIVDVEQNTLVETKDGRTILNDGTEYHNSYINVWKFNEEGKIIDFSEYYNPIILGKAFGVIDKMLEDDSEK